MEKTLIRALIVDDSAYIRKVIRDILSRDGRISVVGTAGNGREALEKVGELRPDVIILDIFMPEMDGIEFIKELAATWRIPTVICSSAEQGGKEISATLEAGAVDVVRKPTAMALESVYEISEQLVERVIAAAEVSPEKLARALTTVPASLESPVNQTGRVQAVVIGLSTGGPKALRILLPQFPANFPLPIAIVLHMPPGYTGPFAEKLNELSAIEVMEARSGLEMRPGRALLACGGFHLTLRKKLAGSVTAQVSDQPHRALLHRPSVDLLFRSAADLYNSRLLGVVMTGMGSDGLEGAAWIKAQGGLIIAEAEESCVVFGMPRAVIEAGLADQVVPLEKIAQSILETI